MAKIVEFAVQRARTIRTKTEPVDMVSVVVEIVLVHVLQQVDVFVGVKLCQLW